MGGMRLHGLSLLFGSLVLATGCKQEMQADITPSNNKSDVPVNAIIHIRYTGRNAFNEATVKKASNYQLVSCEKEETAAQSGGNGTTDNKKTGGKEKKSDGKTEDQEAEPEKKSEAVAGYLITPDANFTDTGDATLERTTDIYFIPYSPTSADPPLKPDTQYCFTVLDMKTAGTDVALGGSISFRTEKTPSLEFASSASVTAPAQDRSVSTNDLIFLRFGTPVHPSDVFNSIKLCGSIDGEKSSASSDKECGGNYKLEPKRVYFVEDLKKTESGYLVTRFDTYAVKGNPLNTNVDYKLITDLADQSSEPVEFKCGEQADPDVSQENQLKSLQMGGSYFIEIKK